MLFESTKRAPLSNRPLIESAPAGAALGILGGGQLGQMFARAAQDLGYRVIVLEPSIDCPASQHAEMHLLADYDNVEALDAMSADCIAASFEFESIPTAAVEYLQSYIPVHPDATALEIAQSRQREKAFAQQHAPNTPPVPYASITVAAEIPEALQRLGAPCILKTDSLGYDGKGQMHIDNAQQASDAFCKFGEVPCVLEQAIDLQREVSVIIARHAEEFVVYPVADNEHRNGILHRSIAPANVSDGIRQQLQDSASAIAEALQYQGVMAVEYFIAQDGAIYFNELAPRPHNSGHYTIDACATSQFEQQVRILCGMELGSTEQHSPIVMINLLGDLWHDGIEPDWSVIRDEPTARLHLYGKREARPGRKMGHFCVLDPDPNAALECAERLYQNLSHPAS